MPAADEDPVQSTYEVGGAAELADEAAWSRLWQ
jgi:hypothetical protein